MAICAYCSEDRPLTREHVIPSFIYNFQKELGDSVHGWNDVAKRMLPSEAKVKDVCAECNNGVLSSLDAYGKAMLTDSGLLTPNYTKSSLTFKYDYSLLLRWLLKLSFNSSRTDFVHAPMFKEHIPFILGLSPPPPKHRVAALLYLARAEPMKLFSDVSTDFASIAQDAKTFSPFLVRLAYGAVSRADCVHRVCVFGPAVFHLLLFPKHVLPGHAAATIRSLLKAQPQALHIRADRGLLNAQAGSQSWLDLYAPQLTRARAIESGSTTCWTSRLSKPAPLLGGE